MDITKLENPHEVEAAMPNALKLMIAYCVKDLSSVELTEMMDNLKWEDNTVRADFVDRYDLGEKIYDAFDLYDIDVYETLNDIQSQRIIEEVEANKE